MSGGAGGVFGGGGLRCFAEDGGAGGVAAADAEAAADGGGAVAHGAHAEAGGGRPGGVRGTLAVVEDGEAFETTRLLATKEGIFVGMSSGAALWGARAAARDLPAGSTVVALFPDRGDRYLSTSLFASICAKCPP